MPSGGGGGGRKKTGGGGRKKTGGGGGGEKSKATTRIGRVWPARVAPQVRPIGVRRIDRSGAAPDYRLPSGSGDGPYAFGHRIIGIGSKEVVITLQGVAL